MSFNDEVDGWISQLMQCKPLSETEVKKLCDKVGLWFYDDMYVLVWSDGVELWVLDKGWWQR